MFYGLTQIEEVYYGIHLNNFVAIAPCIYMEPKTYDQYVTSYGVFRKLGINVLGGPNWANNVKHICANMSEYWCNQAKKRLEKGEEPEPLKNLEWSQQIAVTDRFQEYDPNFTDRKGEPPLISPGLWSIDKVPIHMIVGTKDTHCTLEHA